MLSFWKADVFKGYNLNHQYETKHAYRNLTDADHVHLNLFSFFFYQWISLHIKRWSSQDQLCDFSQNHKKQ